jgi:hypothetical protein
LIHAVFLVTLQLPFTITKTGPSQPILAGQPFTYNVIVTFLGQTKGVKVTDALPASVSASSTPSTWFNRKTNTSTRKQLLHCTLPFCAAAYTAS